MVRINKKSMLKKAWLWLVVSSKNSNKWSLTMKSLIPLLVLWSVSDTETLTNLGGSVGNLVVLIGQVVSGVMTVYGFCRKIWLTGLKK